MESTVKIGSRTLRVDATLMATLDACTSSSERDLVLTLALADGYLDDEDAVLRAIKIREVRREADNTRCAELRVAETRLHAARVERQAARLACRAARVSEEVGE